MKTLHTPNFSAFKIVKAYAGGVVGNISQQTTGSGPGWMTILTGVWTDKHGVISNNTENKAKAKSIFQYLKEHNSKLQTASIATWSPIHDFLDDKMAYVDKRFDGGTDEAATDKVLVELKNNDPDFLFVQFSDPDVIGHVHGYGGKYDQSIRDMDIYLGKIMKVVQERSKKNNEEWLVILTTDHGRRDDGHNHGSQTVEEKTIFVGINQVGNEEFNSIVSEVPNQDYKGIYQYVPQTAIVPTILTYFNVKINREWQLSSTSLIGDLGPRRVMINPNNDSLLWYSKSRGYARIYKNNVFVDSVPAMIGKYKLGEWQDELSSYTIEINGQSCSVIRKNRHVIAGIDWSDSEQVLLYNDKTYIRYSKGKNRNSEIQPKIMSNRDWYGTEAYAEKIETAFRRDKEKMFIFLNDGRYIILNIQENRMEDGYPKEITNISWPGLEPYKNEIVAAVKINDTIIHFFTRDGRYMVFNLKENKTETIYAQPINEETLPGLSPYAGKISAAVNCEDKFLYLFFKNNTFLKYDLASKKVLNKPSPLNDFLNN